MKVMEVKFYQGYEVKKVHAGMRKVNSHPEVNKKRTGVRQAMVEVKRSGIVEAMSERQTIVGDLCHAVVVDERSGNNTNVKYLMALTLRQQQHKYHQHHDR